MPFVLTDLGRNTIGRPDDLEGDHAAHEDVFGLVDAAHAAGAEGVEDAVLAQDEGAAFAGEQPLRLVAGQEAALGQLRRPGAGVAGGPSGGERLDRLGRQQSAGAQRGQELFAGGDDGRQRGGFSS